MEYTLIYLTKDLPIYFRVDDLGLLFFTIETVLWIAGGIFSLAYMKQEKNYRMAYVANCYRPLTRTAAEALEVMREIEEACGLAFTDIVNNSNLAAETDAPAVLDSLDFIRELSELSGLPVFMTTVRADLAEALREHIPNILPLRLQEKYFDLPDQKF